MIFEITNLNISLIKYLKYHTQNVDKNNDILNILHIKVIIIFKIIVSFYNIRNYHTHNIYGENKYLTYKLLYIYMSKHIPIYVCNYHKI